jgi:lycopene cyclase domain-containing protein
MVGLWVLFVARYIPEAKSTPNRNTLRVVVTLALGLLWIVSLFLLIGGQPSATYLALIGVWGLPPIALQTGFGADILWNEKRRVLFGLLPAVLYLSLADSLAINSGTWTINPDKSLEFYLAGVLPFEEFVFFLTTNVLIVFSIVLLLSRQSLERVTTLLNRRVASSIADHTSWASQNSRR